MESNPYLAPSVVAFPEMRRHWWIAYEWEYCDIEGQSPHFSKLRRRTTENQAAAGAEFDEMRLAYRAEKAKHEK